MRIWNAFDLRRRPTCSKKTMNKESTWYTLLSVMHSRLLLVTLNNVMRRSMTALVSGQWYWAVEWVHSRVQEAGCIMWTIKHWLSRPRRSRRSAETDTNRRLEQRCNLHTAGLCLRQRLLRSQLRGMLTAQALCPRDPPSCWTRPRGAPAGPVPMQASSL